MKIHEMLDKPNIIKLKALNFKQLKKLERFAMTVESVQHECTELDKRHLSNIRENSEIIGQILAHKIKKEGTL
ncbi:MAG: hypothetical protein HWN81_00520 [Candidatus Lokiarchaeota archaeon]|nr:hypothetical protein [Candidatus Lokiarchaeota archaeon]